MPQCQASLSRELRPTVTHVNSYFVRKSTARLMPVSRQQSRFSLPRRLIHMPKRRSICMQPRVSAAINFIVILSRPGNIGFPRGKAARMRALNEIATRGAKRDSNPGRDRDTRACRRDHELPITLQLAHMPA